jgi:hypothetical protein
MLPAGKLTSGQSGAAEDERNYCPKHVELIGIINKPLLLHLVGCLYYCINDARTYRHQMYVCNTVERKCTTLTLSISLYCIST